MRRPNFFILGAPKCATTSLAAWLSAHSRIYMPSVKEPHHFNTDDSARLTPDRRDYEALFEPATVDHLAVGEASVWYLHSEQAVPNIEGYAVGARYVVCVRSPIEMAYSLHGQHRVAGLEDVADFAEAWSLSEARSRGEAATRWCKEPRHLAYARVCLLGDQLERLLGRVPRERVLVVVQDDLRRDAGAIYRQVLAFLGVPDDGRVSFPALNAAKRARSIPLRRAMLRIARAKHELGLRRGLGIFNAIERRNVVSEPRPPLPLETRRLLVDHFREDVRTLERLLERDLSAWLTVAGAPAP